MCCLNILLPSTHKQRKVAGLRLLHLQFAQHKCIYMYMEGMYFCNTFLQVHYPLPWMLYLSIPELKFPLKILPYCMLGLGKKLAAR